MDRKSIFDYEDLGSKNNTEQDENKESLNGDENKENISQKESNKTEQFNDEEKSNSESNQNTVTYKQYLKSKPPLVEETHTRDTVLIENGLLREINKLAKKNGKGYKKWLYNTALRAFLEEIQTKK